MSPDVGEEPRVRVRVRSTEPLSGYYSFQGFVELVSTIYRTEHAGIVPSLSCELQDVNYIL